MKKAALLSLLILFISGQTYSGTPKEDLLQAPGARASAMAGAFCAVADDYSAYFWNPAGLIFVEAPMAAVYTDTVLKGGEFSLGLSYQQPVPMGASAGISVMKNFHSNSNFGRDLYYLTAAAFLDDAKSTAFGVNMKFIHSYIADYEAWGFTPAFDFGLLYFPKILEGKMRFGMSIRDIDSSIEWNNGTSERIPAVFKAGAVYMFDKSALVALDFEASDYGGNGMPGRTAIQLGGEKKFYVLNAGEFGIRAGFNWKEAIDPNYKFTFGLSYERTEFAANYVFIPGMLGDTHKFDFNYFFGEQEKQPEEEKKKPDEKKSPAEKVIYAAIYKNMSFETSSRYVSPNNDGRNDSVIFSIKNIPERQPGSEWKLLVTDSAGKEVYAARGGSRIPDAVPWDGMGQGKAALPDGDYTVAFMIEADGEKAYEKARVITVDTAAPAFTQDVSPKYFAPHPKSAANRMEITVIPKYRDIEAWVMAVKDSEGSIIRKFSGEGAPPKLGWDGKDALNNTIIDGEYTVNLALRDFAGNVYEQSEKFTADTYISKFTVLPAARAFKPGAAGVSFSPSARDSSRVKTWDLEIRDSNGRLMASFNGRSPSVKFVTWNGADDENVYARSGSAYFYKVRINQKNGISIEDEGIIQSSLPKFDGTGIELTLAAVDFAAKNDDLPVGEYAYLNQAAEAVKQYAKNYNLFIKGYATDYDDKDKNIELSLKRVKAIADYLINQGGVPAENIYTWGIGDGSYFLEVDKVLIKKNAKRVEIELMTK